ncbi:hypothetical protein CDL15_Pgr022052 [Punica granatum]|uniref:Uncharacterized protein n=1 Tax=Punica granatum TaxID=22663 RepID=A0A218VRZ9_PUNGR|nr:hypothetical protein CDL15_Pgr022052 [Punica granatum]
MHTGNSSSQSPFNYSLLIYGVQGDPQPWPPFSFATSPSSFLFLLADKPFINFVECYKILSTLSIPSLSCPSSSFFASCPPASPPVKLFSFGDEKFPPAQKLGTLTSSCSKPDNDQSSSELRSLDCNLTSLCDHI